MKTKFNGILTLLLAFVVQLTFAQEKTISGTVVDETNMPLPGATVVIKGTTTGTSTDFDGNYSISANSGDVLTFSYVGYADQNATIGASNSINISLALDNTLEAVVVTAMGQKRKIDEITTSTKEVKAEILTQAESPNAVTSLTGKVSGLQINQTNGGANPTTRIVLRGLRSLTGNNEALVVVDGAISSASYLQAMDPKLIASVNVMKGANAAALYGAQGGNGAIIVTTKKGAKGADEKYKISVGSSITFEDVAFLPERQTSYGQGWSGEHYTYENGAWGPAFDGTMQPVGLPNADGTYNYYPYVGNKDNIKEFFKTGTTYQNSISLAGGDANNYINLFAGNQKTEFIIDGDEYSRNTFNFKAGKKLGRFTVRGNATYIGSKQRGNLGTLDSDGNLDASLYEALLETPTNVVVQDYAHGNNEGHWNGYYLNPYWVRDNSRFTTDTDRINALAEVGYEINKNINVIYRANIRVEQAGQQRHVNSYGDPQYIQDVTGFERVALSHYRTYSTNRRNIYSDLLINFDYDLSENFTFKGLIGHNVTDNRLKRLFAGGNDLTVSGFYNTDNISTTPSITDDFYRSRNIGVFGSADIGYKDFLFLNVTGRNDWTSVLDKENRSFFYPSAGLSFIPTKAFPSIKGDILNYAKLSASTVKVGSVDVGAYDINNSYVAPAGYPFNGINSFIQSTSSTDRLLQNQFVNSTEFNANLGFFNDMLTVDGSYYFGTNTKQIIGTSPSYTSGLASATINIGETKSTGYEIDLGINPIKAKKSGDLDVRLNVSYSTNKTTVESLTDGAKELALADYNIDLGIFAVEGEEFPLIKGVGYERDDQGRVIIGANGNPVKSDGYITLGKTTPDYILGITPSVSYKGFNLSAVMDYRTGHQFFSSVKRELARSGYLTESVESQRQGFIFPNSAVETAPGSGVYTANTSVHTGGSSYNDYVSYYTNEYFTTPENFVLDATAFKVREISLSYSFPNKMVTGLGLNELKLGVNARNPFAIYADENQGYADPETSNSSGNDGGLATLSQYPPTKFYGFSVNMTF